jgi:hypothetical protein
VEEVGLGTGQVAVLGLVVLVEAVLEEPHLAVLLATQELREVQILVVVVVVVETTTLLAAPAALASSSSS